MPRRFRVHARRTVVDLQGIWDFTFLGDVEPDEVALDRLVYDEQMAVPGCFDATPAYPGQRGLAAYRTHITLHDRLPHRLIFDGVHHWCRVFLDGKRLGEHTGGFTRFAVDSADHTPGEAELVVLVDNRIDERRSPLHQKHFDWYQFGGIARGVELHRLGSTWIDDVRVAADDIANPAITVTIWYSTRGTPGEASLRIACDGQPILDEQVQLASDSGRLSRSLALPGASLWSPAAPNLHLLDIQLGEDDWCERIGIRQVRVEGRQLLINGQPQRLLGFNRHESHPQFGHSQPEALLIADLQQLRDLGCNFVRGSHYPQDLRFLDLCDEMGICVWSEAIGWQHTAEHLTNPRFVGAQLAHIGEMVSAAANRPSVIVWGLLNESHSHDNACRPAYADLIHRLRELDPTRPITYACNHPFDDVCLDLVDIVSINTYPGWYIGSLAELPAMLDRIVAHIDAGAHAGKPLIISEIGAGAIPGWRDWNGERWTEQYQARLLEAVIRYLFVDRSRACGLSIWLYNDFRTEATVGRPRSFNDKGVVDEYRRPKLGYEAVRRMFGMLTSER